MLRPLANAQVAMTASWGTTFDPIRPNDVHLVQPAEPVDIVKSGDVTDDVFDVQSVDVTADCSYAFMATVLLTEFGRFLVDLTGTDMNSPWHRHR